MKSLVPIVEGKSEVESVGVLLRRILTADRCSWISIAKPIRVKRNQVVRQGELERALQLAVSTREGCAGIVVLLDADDDDPELLEPSLEKRARDVTHLPVEIVLAKKELEAWFLGAKESLRGFRGISKTAAPPDCPEEIRGAKERLSQNMEAQRTYLEVDDQPAFAKKFDIQQAQARCPSLNRFIFKVGRVIEAMVALP